MMRILIRTLLLFISLSIGTGHACMPSYLPYFDLPSYVDPDFKDPGYTDMVLGRKYMIGKILRECQWLQVAQYNPSDSTARASSKITEPEAYAKYLVAAEKFNAGNYKEALPLFEELRKSIRATSLSRARRSQPVAASWVREAATYMIARTHTKIAQNNWHGFSRWSIDIDSLSAQQAEYVYNEYLTEYPHGLYSYSARNLKRYFCNFSSGYCNLDSALLEVIRERFPTDSNSRILIDRKHDVIGEYLLYFKGDINLHTDPPITLVSAVLGENPISESGFSVVSKRKSEFAMLPGLFEYVMSTAMYRLGKHQQVIEMTAEVSGPKNRIWLSTMLLRARSFASLGFSDSAIFVLQRMYIESPEDAIEIEMAVTAFNSNNGLWLYSNQSPITDEHHLVKFAIFGLSDSELVIGTALNDHVGEKRSALVDELAKRFLLSGQYASLHELLLENPNSAYSSIDYLIQALVKNPKDLVALVDLGAFMYGSAVNPWKYSDNSDISPWHADGSEVLVHRCKPCSELTKAHLHPPEVVFKKAVELARKSGRRSESEAKALHFLVVGSRSRSWDHIRLKWTYNSRSDSTLQFNKAAFQRLHRLYKDSPWAKATPYYYK